MENGAIGKVFGVLDDLGDFDVSNQQISIFSPQEEDVMQRIFAAIVLAASLAIVAAGCSMFAEPGYSENYAIRAECSVPEMIDGSMRTAGKTHPAEYERGGATDDSRYNEATVTIKEPKTIRKVVVRRRPDEAVSVDINVEAMVDGEWKLIKEVRSAEKQDIDILVNTFTDKIKVRLQRSTRTSKGKSGIAQAAKGQGGRTRSQDVTRLLREPVLIAEIELYGLAPKVESEGS